MATTTILLLTGLVLLVAFLYATVGHAGASGYLASMALLGVAPDVMKPTALALNVLVASIATFKFVRAGCFSWRVFAPLALGSIPCAFVGGRLHLPGDIYKRLVGSVLIYAAYRLLRSARPGEPEPTRAAPAVGSIGAGAAIGLLSGLTGVGGGIFLSPFLLLMRWATVRQTAGISAAFILVNSISALLGNVASLSLVPASLPLLAVAAVVGGYAGAEFGSRRLQAGAMRKLLACVVAFAAVKMLLG